jgi:aspartate kinase
MPKRVQEKRPKVSRRGTSARSGRPRAKVLEFSESCLKDGAGYRRVADIVKSGTGSRVVVVSAADGIRDLLMSAIDKAGAPQESTADVVSHIAAKHRALARAAARRPEIQWELHRDLEAKLGVLNKLLLGISFTGEASPSARSRILSYGPRLSALILAAALRDQGLKSEAWEADAIGMVTDQVAENATVDLRLFKANFEPFARRIRGEEVVPVISGNFGSPQTGRISIFGRNGSDYSASVVAHALGAKALEIWEDEDIFFSADPHLVGNPAALESLSYAEAAELAYFGERILHPRALEPLAGMTISLAVKSLARPDGPGTRLTPRGSIKPDIVKSVVTTDDIAMLRIHGPGVGYQPGIIGRVGQSLADVGINIDSVITSQTRINLLLDRKDARRGLEQISVLTGGVIQRIDLKDDVSLVAVVGEGFLGKPGIAARILGAVSRENINVEMISIGASEVAAYLMVHRDLAGKAVNAIHREFFG